MSSFKLAIWIYDAGYYFVIKLSGTFLILTIDDVLQSGWEMKYEIVEIYLQYYLLKNCYLASSVKMFPSKFINVDYTKIT